MLRCQNVAWLHQTNWRALNKCRQLIQQDTVSHADPRNCRCQFTKKSSGVIQRQAASREDMG